MQAATATNERAEQSPHSEVEKREGHAADPPNPRATERRHQYWRPSGLTLAVEAPPETFEQALQVAAELSSSSQALALKSGSPTRISRRGHNATSTLAAITATGGTLRAYAPDAQRSALSQLVQARTVQGTVRPPMSSGAPVPRASACQTDLVEIKNRTQAR
jgi:hypothetical protein